MEPRPRNVSATLRFCAGSAVFLLAFAFVSRGEAADKPNIILIMADDLGYECLGVHGGAFCRTLSIDNVKYIGHHKCSDGANIGSCDDVRVTRSFFRGFDDILCIKGLADTPGVMRGGFDDKQGGTIPGKGWD